MIRSVIMQIMRTMSLAVVLLVVFTMTAYGVIFTSSTDECDDVTEIRAVASEKDVVAFRKEIDAVRARLLKFKERDIEALFGESIPKPEKTYAMPIAQHRGFGLSGRRYGDAERNRDHTEFYVTGQAALEVYYSIDGTSPSCILIYFRADETFPRLTGDNINERLAWDRIRLDEFKTQLEQRRSKVFVWEVDVKKEKDLYAELFQLDLKSKLDAWTAHGEQSGYQLRIRKDSDGRSSRWKWYDKAGKLVLEARCEGKVDTLPRSFRWYHADGRSVRRTEYTGGQKSITCWWWCHAGSTSRFRSEFSQLGHWRPDRWSWGGGDAGDVHRQEWDDNEDGIPDWFSESGDGYVQRHLPPSDSWALHPRLIPQAYRIQNQANRCVPVRRIVPQTETKDKETPNKSLESDE